MPQEITLPKTEIKMLMRNLEKAGYLITREDTFLEIIQDYVHKKQNQTLIRLQKEGRLKMCES